MEEKTNGDDMHTFMSENGIDEDLSPKAKEILQGADEWATINLKEEGYDQGDVHIAFNHKTHQAVIVGEEGPVGWEGFGNDDGTHKAGSLKSLTRKYIKQTQALSEEDD